MRKSGFVPEGGVMKTNGYHPDTHHTCTVHAGTFVQQVQNKAHTFLNLSCCFLQKCGSVMQQTSLILSSNSAVSSCSSSGPWLLLLAKLGSVMQQISPRI